MAGRDTYYVVKRPPARPWRQRLAAGLAAGAALLTIGVPWGRPLASAPCGAVATDAAESDRHDRPLDSGLKVGEKVSTFYVRAVTGPLKNKSVCYVCRNGERPVVMVFFREITPAVAQLLREIDAVVDRNRATGLRSFGVFLPREGPGPLADVQTLAFNEQIAMPLTISAGGDSPPGQKVHPRAAVTVVLYRELVVEAAFACRSGELDAGRSSVILQAVRSLAGENAPPNR